MSRKRQQILFTLLLVISVMLVSGCTQPSTPAPPATVPEALLALPRKASIECLHNPLLDKDAQVRIFSLPGRRLPDTDSGISGYRGKEIGSLTNCTLVSIIEIKWDPYDAVYWVKITHNNLEGWLKINLVSIEE